MNSFLLCLFGLFGGFYLSRLLAVYKSQQPVIKLRLKKLLDIVEKLDGPYGNEKDLYALQDKIDQIELSLEENKWTFDLVDKISFSHFYRILYPFGKLREILFLECLSFPYYQGHLFFFNHKSSFCYKYRIIQIIQRRLPQSYDSKWFEGTISYNYLFHNKNKAETSVWKNIEIQNKVEDFHNLTEDEKSLYNMMKNSLKESIEDLKKIIEIL